MLDFDFDRMLFKISPEEHGKEDLIRILNEHPEVEFVSYAGIDIAGNDTDERIPVKMFIKDIDAMLKTGVQTDGSSVHLPRIADLNNAKVDMAPDLDVNWYVDYNFDNVSRKTALPVGTLRIPAFLVHNDRAEVGSRAILRDATETFKSELMNLLKEIAKDRLVIMVTHNPDLAEEYSTRIIRLLDGKVIDDTMPFETEDFEENKTKVKEKKPSMSFFTALSLSLNNLMTKKARTFLTSFAGSIGIIGIALILSLSSGVNAYIRQVEEETLSSYPITIEQAGMDMTSLANDLMGKTETEIPEDSNKIYSNNIMTDMMSAMVNGISVNNLKLFKEHLDTNEEFKEYVSQIEYGYSTPLNIYSMDGEHINPNQIFNTLMASMGAENVDTNSMPASSMMTNSEVWHQLFDDNEIIKNQYDIVAGKLPEKYNEVVRKLTGPQMTGEDLAKLLEPILKMHWMRIYGWLQYIKTGAGLPKLF